MLRHQVDVQRWIGEVAACPGNWGFCGDKPGAWNAAFKIWLRPSKVHMLVRGSRCSWAEHASLGVDEVADFLHMCTNVWDEGQKQLLGFYVANSRAKSSSTNEHTLWYDGGNPPPGAVGGYRGAERGAKVGGVLGSGLTKPVVSGITLDVHATSRRNRTRQGRCSPRKSGSGPREAVVATPNQLPPISLVPQLLVPLCTTQWAIALHFTIIHRLDHTRTSTLLTDTGVGGVVASTRSLRRPQARERPCHSCVLC